MAPKKMFAIIDWDDGTTNDIPVSLIKIPRKEEDQYFVGDRVQANSIGYGFCWGVLAAVDVDRTYLRSKLLGPRPVIDDRHKITENDAPAQSPKRTVNKKHSSVQEGDSIHVSSAKKQKRPLDTSVPDLPVIEKLKSRKGRATPRPVKQKSPIDSELESEAEYTNMTDEDDSDSELDDPPASTSTPISNKKKKAPANEGKTVKAEENKKKRLIKKDRESLNLESSLQIIEPDSCSCSCKETYKILEGKVNKILQLLENFTECKTCFKKAYKVHV